MIEKVVGMPHVYGIVESLHNTEQNRTEGQFLDVKSSLDPSRKVRWSVTLSDFNLSTFLER